MYIYAHEHNYIGYKFCIHFPCLMLLLPEVHREADTHNQVDHSDGAERQIPEGHEAKHPDQDHDHLEHDQPHDDWLWQEYYCHSQHHWGVEGKGHGRCRCFQRYQKLLSRKPVLSMVPGSLMSGS